MVMILLAVVMAIAAVAVIVGVAISAYKGTQLPVHYITIPLAAIAGMIIMALARSI